MAKKNEIDYDQLAQALAKALGGGEDFDTADKLTALVDYFDEQGEFSRGDDGESVTFKLAEPKDAKPKDAKPAKGKGKQADDGKGDEKPESSKETLLRLLSGGKKGDKSDKSDKGDIDPTDVKPSDWLTGVKRFTA